MTFPRCMSFSACMNVLLTCVLFSTTAVKRDVCVAVLAAAASTTAAAVPAATAAAAMPIVILRVMLIYGSSLAVRQRATRCPCGDDARSGRCPPTSHSCANPDRDDRYVGRAADPGTQERYLLPDETSIEPCPCSPRESARRIGPSTTSSSPNRPS